MMRRKERDFLILDEIKKTLDKHVDKEKDLGVVSGLSGILLFYFSYALLLESDKEFEKSKKRIQIGLELINQGYNNPTYSNGITGFCWVLQFLNDQGIIEVDGDDFFSQIEDFIHEVMKIDIENKNYDLLHGSMGYALFFLKRYKSTKRNDLKNKYKANIESFIHFLDVSKLESKDGYLWESPQESDIDDEVNIDLGMAHGIPSILYFLCLVYEEGICKEKIYPLIHGAKRYLLSVKNKSENIISLFPTYQYVSLSKEEHVSRLGWCYGDIGIGLSLLKTANILEDQELKEEAIHILVHSSKRRDLEENSVYDAGICHGTYGLFHMYGKLYKKTSIDHFKEASLYWKEVADGMIKYKETGDVYYPIHFGERTWSRPFSLLEGISGIGLSIISGLTNYEIEWDECLFI